jgi:hypothetical protein
MERIILSLLEEGPKTQNIEFSLEDLVSKRIMPNASRNQMVHSGSFLYQKELFPKQESTESA